MKISEAMTKNPLTVDRDSSASDAARIMRDHDIGSLPVVGDKQLVGFITDRDIVVRCVARDSHAPDTRVRDVMTPEIYFCTEEQSPREAMDIMAKHQVQRLPVLDDNDRLTGIVTLGQLAEQISEPEKVCDTIKSVRQPVGA